jgi:inositol polyphosphate 1-phosphatase
MFRWSGRYLWGISYNGFNRTGSSGPLPDAVLAGPPSERSAVTLSNSENKGILSKLSEKYELVYSSGAGYKLLCVADRLVDLYFLSKGSTYKWDTCAPHAVLLAQGGGIVDFQAALGAVHKKQEIREVVEHCQLTYHVKNTGCSPDSVECWANINGIIAYSNIDQLIDMLNYLV